MKPPRAPTRPAGDLHKARGLPLPSSRPVSLGSHPPRARPTGGHSGARETLWRGEAVPSSPAPRRPDSSPPLASPTVSPRQSRSPAGEPAPGGQTARFRSPASWRERRLLQRLRRRLGSGPGSHPTGAGWGTSRRRARRIASARASALRREPAMRGKPFARPSRAVVTIWKVSGRSPPSASATAWRPPLSCAVPRARRQPAMPPSPSSGRARHRRCRRGRRSQRAASPSTTAGPPRAVRRSMKRGVVVRGPTRRSPPGRPRAAPWNPGTPQ